MMNKETCVYALPGTMCDSKVWSKMALSDHGIAIEHIDIPMESSMDDILRALADIFPETPIRLMGFSLGGYIASAFCCQYPHRVSSLAVLSNSPGELPESEVRQRQQLISWIEKEGYIGITPNKIRSLLHRKHWDNDDFFRLIEEMDERCGKATLVHQLKVTTLRKDIGGALCEAQVPLSFFYGEQDSLIDEKKIESLSDQYSLVSRHKFSGAGHMLPLEAPGALTHALHKFFTQ